MLFPEERKEEWPLIKEQLQGEEYVVSFYRDEPQKISDSLVVSFAPDFIPPFGLSTFISQAESIAVAVTYAENKGQALLELEEGRVSSYRPRDLATHHDGFIPMGIAAVQREQGGQKGQGAQAIPLPQANDKWQWNQRRPALCLDRDGIINVDRGYVHRPEQIELYEEVIELIRWANERQWWVFVLSNQSGVARRKFTGQQVEALHQYLRELLAQKGGVRVDDWFYCPFLPLERKGPFCKVSALRKPGPGMLLLAAQKYAVDLEKIFMIGDKLSDELEMPGLQGAHLQRDDDLTRARWPVFSNYGQVLKYLKEWGGL